MFDASRNHLFNAFADWAIRRAMRTPYFHLFHDDGRPYMERFWLLRIGMPRGWRQLEADVKSMEACARAHELVAGKAAAAAGKAAAAGRWARATEWRAQLYPRFGICIHRIQSSDARAFHDHPWNFTTLILRGGYTEYTPSGIDASQITLASEYDGSEPVTYTRHCAVRYRAGQVLRRRASAWHYLQLEPGAETWTMFCVGRKRHRWGFLVDGLLKVPYDIYLRARAARTKQ